MNTTGKIARLPRDLRIKLNRRLDNGLPSHEILDWLNRDNAPPPMPAEPPLPPGDYGTVHVMGHEQREGWVTDGSIAGAACLDVRDEAGRLIAKIPPHSVYMFEPGFPPQVLARMGAPLAALPAGPLPAHHFDERYDEDDEPAGEFAGHVDPGADF